MERLTERLTDKSYCISDIRSIQKETFYEDMECRRGFDLYTGKAIDRLAEYEDLEEQGKLLKLPCAVGDTVYYVDNEYYFTVLPVKVDEISIMESNAFLCKCLLFNGNGDVETQFDFDKDDFGKTVFLTRQEAEDKLAEMEGKK